MTDDHALLKELLTEQRATNDLLRLLVMPTLRQTLVELLQKPAERKAYELSDGVRGTREIGELAGASPGSISNWWRKWRTAGIAAEAEGGRVRHLMPLSALGIEIEGSRSR